MRRILAVAELVAAVGIFLGGAFLVGPVVFGTAVMVVGVGLGWDALFRDDGRDGRRFAPVQPLGSGRSPLEVLEDYRRAK